MATLNDAISLSKSASILATNNCEMNTMEVVDLYGAAYVKFAMVADSPNADKTEVLIQWGITLTNHYKLKGLKGEEAEKIFETAQQKFESALLSGKDVSHLVLSHWGNLLLEKGRKLKGEGKKDLALESLAQASRKFSESFNYNSVYLDNLLSWKLALSEQAILSDGNQRLWFDSQVAEKARWIDKLNKNEPLDFSGKRETPQEKLKNGNIEKEKGNEYFKKGEYTNALKHYHNALNYANGLYGLPPQDEKALKELKGSIYNNMAVVHMKQGKHDRAITDLKMVLEVDGNNVKALFRRGKLWLIIGDVDKARGDLDKARTLDPSNKEILLEIQALEKKEKELIQKQKQFFSKMFN